MLLTVLMTEPPAELELEAAAELPPEELPPAGAEPEPRPEPELLPEPEAGALSCVADETPEVTEVTAWLAADVTGAAALVTVVAECETADEAWLTVEPTAPAADDGEAAGVVGTLVVEAGWVTPETAPLTVLVTPLTTPETVPAAEPRRFPTGSGVDDAGAAVAARLAVAAWALDPDRSQNAAIKPKQQPTRARARVARRPAP